MDRDSIVPKEEQLIVVAMTEYQLFDLLACSKEALIIKVLDATGKLQSEKHRESFQQDKVSVLEEKLKAISEQYNALALDKSFPEEISRLNEEIRAYKTRIVDLEQVSVNLNATFQYLRLLRPGTKFEYTGKEWTAEVESESIKADTLPILLRDMYAADMTED